MKMALGMEVGLGPDGDRAFPPQKAAQKPPTFWPMSIVAKRSPISATAELVYLIGILSKATTGWANFFSKRHCR